MADFVKVCGTGDVPSGGMKGFDQNGKKFLVANVGGKFYAMDSVCTHRQCPLEEGSLEGDVLECSCHGSKFDLKTGAIMNPPARVPEKVYPVKVQGSDVLVQL